MASNPKLLDRYAVAGAYLDVHTEYQASVDGWVVYTPENTIMGTILYGLWGDDCEEVYSANSAGACIELFPSTVEGFEAAVIWIITTWCVANCTEEERA